MAERSSAEIAFRYVDRLMGSMEALERLPERFQRRPQLGADVRATPFDGAYQIAYRVRNDTVVVLALFGPGQTLTPVEDRP